MNHREVPRRGFCRSLTAFAVLLSGTTGWPALSVADKPTKPNTLEEVLVIATTPLPGTFIDIDKIPGNVQSLLATDLVREGSASLTGALSSRLGSVNINDTLADPFQPDILYRGFEASPVLGNPQGLAVYQNGVRINEAFGDVVNWDLFPSIAVGRVDVVSSNPAYGLNALGGAVAVTMKNGFSSKGVKGELFGGSFSQRAASVEAGAHDDHWGIYAAATALNQDGWRLFAHDSVRQFYLDLSTRGSRTVFDLSYTFADNQLHGAGAAPVQELAISRELVFTGPQNNANRLDFVTFNAAYDATETLSAQGVLYYRDYRQTVANGNTTDFTACATADNIGLLCQSDGMTPLLDAAGETLPDISNGETLPIGENDFEAIDSRSYGGSLQVNDTRPVLGHDNQFALGVTFDSARIDFSSGTQVGVIDSTLTVLPSTLLVNTPEGTDFPATPVSLRATNKYYGFFLTDTFDVTPAFAVTVSGRYNIAQVNLADQLGTNLTGNNRFSHVNPAIGATYKLLPGVTAYAGYSTSNRAPTASEIECSDPLQPCLLPANLAGDPPNLQQVVAHTYEVGLRGRSVPAGKTSGGLTWNLSLFRTNLEDDIYAISTSLSSGFFQNIGSTRRQGLEAGINYQGPQWSSYAQYSFIDATFRSSFTESSPSNPFQDANGDIQIQSGDQLPGIPRHRIKAGADYSIRPNWTLGGTLIWVSSQYYRGDESNQNPQLAGYYVLGLHASYRVNGKLNLFASVQNVFDAQYATYGLYGDPTGVGAPGIPPGAASNAPGVDNRFQSPASPRAVFGGIRFSF